MTPTIVRRLDVDRLDLALAEPFGIARGAQLVAANVLVSVELADGTRGYGEAAPFPAFNGETQADAVRALEAARSVVVGADARALRRVAEAARPALAGVASAKAALEVALLDAILRHAGLPMWAYFGGAATSLETDLTITTGDERSAREAAITLFQDGFRTAKVKVGGRHVDDDVARLHAVVRAAPGVAVVLDANASLTVDEAVGLVRALERSGVPVALFEQPVAGGDLEGLAAVGERTGVPIAADESVASAADALAIARRGAASVLNVKLTKMGLLEALDVVAIARAAGLGLMIGGMVESSLAMTASACFAAGLGGFRFVDLDTPFFLVDEPFDGAYGARRPTIDLASIVAGHGVTPRRPPP